MTKFWSSDEPKKFNKNQIIELAKSDIEILVKERNEIKEIMDDINIYSMIKIRKENPNFVSTEKVFKGMNIENKIGVNKMSKETLYVTRFNCPSCGTEHYEFEYDQYDYCKKCNANLNEFNWNELKDKFRAEDLKLQINIEDKNNINFVWIKDED
jgi:hypothetical protein